MFHKAHVYFPEHIRILPGVLMARSIARWRFFNARLFEIGKKTLHSIAYIAQGLAISQVAEQKWEQVSQYVQILATFVAFVFFSAAFTISRGIFLTIWGKRCSLAMEGVCFVQPQYMVYWDKLNLPFLFFVPA